MEEQRKMRTFSLRQISFSYIKLLIVYLLFFTIPTFSQTNQAPHLLYVANILVDDVSVERMAQTCRFHHLTEAPSEDGYAVFTDAKGNKLCFKKSDDSDLGVNGKLIELQSTDNIKTLERILKETGYKKLNNTYEKGNSFTLSRIRCNLTSRGKIKVLTFLKIKNK